MNHQGSALIGRIAQWAVAILGIIFVIMIFSGMESGIDGGLYVSYIAMVVSAATAVIFSFMGLNKKSLMGIGAFAVLFVLAYAIADGSVRPEWGITESASKWIGAGLIMLYVAMATAVGTILYGEITRMFK